LVLVVGVECFMKSGLWYSVFSVLSIFSADFSQRKTLTTLYDFVSGRHWPPRTHWTTRGRRRKGKESVREIVSQLSCVKNIYTTIF